MQPTLRISLKHLGMLHRTSAMKVCAKVAFENGEASTRSTCRTKPRVEAVSGQLQDQTEGGGYSCRTKPRVDALSGQLFGGPFKPAKPSGSHQQQSAAKELLTAIAREPRV